MNYIAEIRAFYDWVQFNLIPADAQALWHALMFLNNKCAIQINGQWLWRVEFTVANTTLQSMLKFSRTQLDRMRNVLIQSGRIEYRKGRGNQSGTYKIVPFDTQYVAQTVTQSATQSDTQTVTQVWRIPGPLNNINYNSNSNKNDDVDDAAREHEDGEDGKKTPTALFCNFFNRNPTPAEAAQCERWLQAKEYDLVEYAFFRACKTDNKNLAYVGGILKNLKSRGIKNMGDIADYDVSHERGKT